jgi:hypothetical protein
VELASTVLFDPDGVSSEAPSATKEVTSIHTVGSGITLPPRCTQRARLLVDTTKVLRLVQVDEVISVRGLDRGHSRNKGFAIVPWNHLRGSIEFGLEDLTDLSK